MTTIYYIRHAEPDLSEHRDDMRPLSPKGMADRLLVTRYLSYKDISALYSSPYLRSKQTIEDFAEKSDLTINIADDLRERKVGDKWIDDFTTFAKRQWSDHEYHLPKGESLGDVRRRQISALEAILRRHGGESIAAGGHGTAICSLISHFDPSFGYGDFLRVKMPHAVKFVFDDKDECISLVLYDLFTGETEKRI